MSERHHDKVKTSRIPLRVCVVYLLIASFLFTGVAFSKYVRSGGASDSARVATIGEVIITETGDIASAEIDGDTTNNTFIVTPGVPISKDARLHFDGSEMACYIFLRIDPNGFSTVDNFSFKNENEKVSWSIDSSWNFLKADGDTLIYYYVVESNGAIESKPILKESKVFVSEYLTRTELDALPELLDLSFKATAVQYDGFGDFDTEIEHALAAWTSISKY